MPIRMHAAGELPVGPFDFGRIGTRRDAKNAPCACLSEFAGSQFTCSPSTPPTMEEFARMEGGVPRPGAVESAAWRAQGDTEGHARVDELLERCEAGEHLLPQGAAHQGWRQAEFADKN